MLSQIFQTSLQNTPPESVCSRLSLLSNPPSCSSAFLSSSPLSVSSLVFEIWISQKYFLFNPRNIILLLGHVKLSFLYRQWPDDYLFAKICKTDVIGLVAFVLSWAVRRTQTFIIEIFGWPSSAYIFFPLYFPSSLHLIMWVCAPLKSKLYYLTVKF